MPTEVYRRNTLLVRRQVLGDDGNPLDLTGASLVYVISTPGGRIIQKSTAQGTIDVTDGAAGQIEILLNASDTDIPPGSYHEELLVVDVSGHRYTSDQDSLTVLKSYTA